MNSSDKDATTPEGLTVYLEDLVYRYVPEQTSAARPHLFAYYLKVVNESEDTVTLLARKWVIKKSDGTVDVVEGDKIVGQSPTIQPGESFSFNSFHLIGSDSTASGALHGVDDQGRRIFAPIPSFNMEIPENTA